MWVAVLVVVGAIAAEAKQAWELYRVEQYEEALTVSREALKVAEKQFGKSGPQVAESLSS